MKTNISHEFTRLSQGNKFIGVVVFVLIAGIYFSAHAVTDGEVAVPLPCTHKSKACNTYQNWRPGQTCCLNAGGFQSGEVPEDPSLRQVIVTDGTTTCGAKFKSSLLLPCGVPQEGGCGGLQYNGDCS